jgi:exodeoxyribonuclease VII small subunit
MLQYCELDERKTLIYPLSVPNQSKSAGPNSSATAKQTHPPFEEALQKLEGIVEAMESDDLPLETLLARYEEGAKLVKICQEKLAEAELKIQQLEKTAAGEMKLKPIELSAE